MSMTKKDYEAFAAAFMAVDGQIIHADTEAEFWAIRDYRNALLDKLCKAFKDDNMRFDSDRFKDACIPDWDGR